MDTSCLNSSGTLESFDHLGFGTVVTRAHSQPGVDLTYLKRSGESNADAGDQYIGLDRFGRVADHRWVLTSNGTARACRVRAPKWPAKTPGNFR